MTDRPILFSAPMVRALLDGSKTQTRRIAKHPLAVAAKRIHSYKSQAEFDCILSDETGGIIHCPYGRPGDRLWVRETFRLCGEGPGDKISMFESDEVQYFADEDQSYIGKYRPSIHMPRRLSRITLEITAVRVGRLQEISEVDAKAEGIEPTMPNPGHWNWRDYLIDGGQTHAVLSYKTLWESINGPGSWDENPFVWVVSFRRIGL